MRDVKVVCVGDGAVGKTSLLMSYSQEKFPTEYVPTIFDNFRVHKTIDGEATGINLWDTAGQAEFDNIRMLSYPETDIVMICFSIACSASHENVTHKWAPEIKQHCDGVPVILVGTKSDWRSSPDKPREPLISEADGYRLQKEIGAKKYIEVSAMTWQNIDELFHEAVRIVVNPVKPPKSSKCVLL